MFKRAISRSERVSRFERVSRNEKDGAGVAAPRSRSGALILLIFNPC